MEEKQNKKPLTIKDVLQDDKLYIDEIKETRKCSMAEALSYVIEQAKTSELLKENEAETAVIKAKTDEENKKLLELVDVVNLQAASLLEENGALKNTVSEMEVTIEAAEIAAKNIKNELSEFQFICDLGEDLSREARKMRKFLKEYNYKKFNSFEVPETETPANYIQRLTKFSVSNLLKNFKNDYL